MATNSGGRPGESRPGIPGMTVDPDAEIRGDAPDEPAEDDDIRDDEGEPVDHDEGVIGVADDDTVGVDDHDDDERFGIASPREGEPVDET